MSRGSTKSNKQQLPVIQSNTQKQYQSVKRQQLAADQEAPDKQRITPASQLQCYRVKGTPFKFKVNKIVTRPDEMTTR